MSDLLRVVRAAATNQLARFTPALYVRLTGQTGRGSAEESVADIAAYFCRCVDDYFERLQVAPGEVAAFLSGKVLMEYGPGDLPGVAALMVARGAQKVYCVDRFPLVRLSGRNVRVMQALIAGCRHEERERLLSCLADPGDPAKGFDPERIEYLVKPNGMSGLVDEVDFVYSRAVLEHVNDLPGTFADMARAMRPGSQSIHLADLRSHGLHKANPLDFLEWSPAMWSLMYSEKGVPNRWRVDEYRRILTGLGVRVGSFEPTALATAADIAAVRPRLAAPFQRLSDTDLACLGIWFDFEKPKT